MLRNSTTSLSRVHNADTEVADDSAVRRTVKRALNQLCMEAPAISLASTHNRRRTWRRRARRLHQRVEYIQQSIVDDRDDVIEIWIAATLANAGRLPAGLISDPALAVAGESDNAALAPYPICAGAWVSPSDPRLERGGRRRARQRDSRERGKVTSLVGSIVGKRSVQ